MANCDRSEDNKCIICGQKVDSNDVTCPRCAWYAFMILLNYDELNKALKEDKLHLSSEDIKFRLDDEVNKHLSNDTSPIKAMYGPYSKLESIE